MMRGLVALQIDFQQREAGGAPRLGWLVLMLGTVMLAGILAQYADVDAAVTAAQMRAEQARHAARRSTPARSQDSGDSAQAVKAMSIVRGHLSAPWGTLFHQIEAAAHEDIAMLSLQADPAARTVRVSGESRNFAALMGYVRRLEASTALADVTLAGHEVRQQDPRRPVAFTLSATWVTR